MGGADEEVRVACCGGCFLFVLSEEEAEEEEEEAAESLLPSVAPRSSEVWTLFILPFFLKFLHCVWVLPVECTSQFFLGWTVDTVHASVWWLFRFSHILFAIVDHDS